MNMPAAVVIALIVAFIVIREWRLKHAETGTADETPLFDSARLQREISALYHASQELESVDRMILDLRLCKPSELHKAFRISWSSCDGNQSLDFMAAGDDATTAGMMKLASERREAVNADILERITDLYSRAQELSVYTAYNRERNAENCAENDDRGSAYASES